jgi:hypothetical protein
MALLFGKTKYSFGKMTKLALKGITSFSFKPLRIAILIGSIISLKNKIKLAFEPQKSKNCNGDKPDYFLQYCFVTSV